MPPQIKSVELPSRIRLEYVEQGDRAGVPVVFLHGITDSCRSFEGLLPHLPGSIHAIALSQRGHGDSDRPTAGYAPRDFAADLAALMDALGLGPAVIAGHSMGSHIARRFALDYPERTVGLVLMGSFGSFRDNPPILELWEAVSTLTDPVDSGFALEFQESTLAQPVPPAFLQMVVRESLKVPARVWREALEGLLEADFSGELGSLRVPTLIAWGDQDAFCPWSDQEALAAAISDAQLVVYPGGHAFHWEEPERFAADLTAFAEQLVCSRNGRPSIRIAGRRRIPCIVI